MRMFYVTGSAHSAITTRHDEVEARTAVVVGAPSMMMVASRWAWSYCRYTAHIHAGVRCMFAQAARLRMCAIAGRASFTPLCGCVCAGVCACKPDRGAQVMRLCAADWLATACASVIGVRVRERECERASGSARRAEVAGSEQQQVRAYSKRIECAVGNIRGNVLHLMCSRVICMHLPRIWCVHYVRYCGRRLHRLRPEYVQTRIVFEKHPSHQTPCTVPRFTLTRILNQHGYRFVSDVVMLICCACNGFYSERSFGTSMMLLFCLVSCDLHITRH